MNRTRFTIGLLLALVLVALVCSQAFLGRGDAPASSAALGPGSALDGARLEQRIAELEERMARLQDALEALRLRHDSARIPEELGSEGIDVAELAKRVASLERGLPVVAPDAQAAARSRELDPEAQEHIPGISEEERAILRRMVTEWTTTALDPLAEESARLMALRGLSGNHHADGTDARLAVLPQMIQLAQGSPNAATRAEVWRELYPLSDPALLSPVLDSLRRDASEDVRAAAARLLVQFRRDPLAKGALEHAAQYDFDEDVRSQATRSLAGQSEQ